MEATLERLRATRQSTVPPRAAYNPPAGGTPGGGLPTGIDNARLSQAARGAIGDRIRECWTGDHGALDYDKQVAHLRITTDENGTIRQAEITQTSGTPVGRAFAERARRAALDAQCATLPLPPTMLGTNHTFEITFRP